MFHTTFYLRRLHSLVGLLAIGIFLFEHIITNARALGGAESLNGALAMMELIPHPIFLGLEIFGVALPILFHAIYGIYIALQAKNNPGRYGYVRNWQFALQRWTAWFLVVFLIWHVFYLRIFTKAINGTPISLLSDRALAVVGPARPHTAARRSLVDVLPTDPVMPITGPSS